MALATLAHGSASHVLADVFAGCGGDMVRSSVSSSAFAGESFCAMGGIMHYQVCIEHHIQHYSFHAVAPSSRCRGSKCS